MDGALPPPSSALNTWNTLDHDPHNAYNNACYHYQAYLYYWNLYNSHFNQSRDSISYCECYDYGHVRQPSPWVALPTSKCIHCPGYIGHLNPSETQPHFHEESYEMDTEERTYGDIDGADVHGDDDHEDEDEEQDFELDEKFCQFLRQSEKHRQEREKEKRANAKLNEYVEAGKSYFNASTLPPKEQQGLKRKEAMKSLYGDKAQYIMSLEASLQLHCDRNYDNRQPKYWPNIPLKF